MAGASWAGGGGGGSAPAVVIDCGSGYTKLGYAGNTAPTFAEPTALAAADGGAADIGRAGASDLDCYFGVDALAHAKSHQLGYPMRAGLIDNWASMERVWHRCFYERLHVQPSEHHVLLTEPPLNPPENRELTAEVMFETFNVPGLYIGVQAVLALAASWVGLPEDRRTLTGTVVDSGDGATHVIPVADGYVLGSAIRHMPLAGRDLSLFVQRCLRERGEPVPPEDSLEVARRIKEQLCYVAQDAPKERAKFDADPAKYFRKLPVLHPRTKAPISVGVGYEAFMAPELFFSPEGHVADWKKPLPEVVDEAILACPIDTRRGLYKNIVLSGGTTLIKNFGKRLQQGVKDRVQARLAANLAKLRVQPESAPAELKVRVHTHALQRHAVWFGGSLLASQPDFQTRLCVSKERYLEEGPRVARHSPVFQL